MAFDDCESDRHPFAFNGMIQEVKVKLLQ